MLNFAEQTGSGAVIVAIELPPRIEQLLQRAHRVKNQLENSNHKSNNSNSNSDGNDDDDYTNELVARRLGVTPEALRRYERASREALSVCTIEVDQNVKGLQKICIQHSVRMIQTR